MLCPRSLLKTVLCPLKRLLNRRKPELDLVILSGRLPQARLPSYVVAVLWALCRRLIWSSRLLARLKVVSVVVRAMVDRRHGTCMTCM